MSIRENENVSVIMSTLYDTFPEFLGSFHLRAGLHLAMNADVICST